MPLAFSLPRRPVMIGFLTALLCLLFALSGCGATVVPLIPTALPTATLTHTPSPTRTPGVGATPTQAPTQPRTTATGGPSPTPLFGPTQTPRVIQASTATRPANPNAPRIEFFTSDVLAVAPGGSLTLFWSTRGADGATIYRVDNDGVRSQLWNVPPDGNLPVQTRRADRLQVEFVLSVGDGSFRTEQSLVLPLSCPDTWFFEPQPAACPQGPAVETRLIEQPFERGRILYIEGTGRVYALFNDGFPPAWVVFENRFDPARHPESEESFVPPPGLVQPLRQIGFVWRGNDTVRGRLGLGVAPESSYQGFVQLNGSTATTENIYVSSGDGTVLQLLPGGAAWQIIARP